MKRLLALLMTAVMLAAVSIPVFGGEFRTLDREEQTALLCKEAEDYVDVNVPGKYKYEPRSLVLILDAEYSGNLDFNEIFAGAEYYFIYERRTAELDFGRKGTYVRVGLYENPYAVDFSDAEAIVSRMKRAINEFMAIDLVLFAMPYPYDEYTAVPNVITLSTGEDVEDGKVIVGIKREYSALTKEWSFDDFAGVGAYGISYLTHLRSGKPEDCPDIDTWQYSQTLVLSIGSGEEALCSAIDALKALDFVADAFPNYILYPDDNELEGEDPTKATVRFYRDADKTDEITDLSEIAAGDRVWFSVTPPDGYACVSFKVNFAELTMEELCIGDSFINGVIASIPGSEFEYTVQTALKGDINGDGALNARDVTTFMRALVDPSRETYWMYIGYNPVADVNNDVRYNAKDVTRLMKHLVDPTVKICEKTFCEFDCLIKAEPLFFFEGSTVPGISGYSELIDFAEAHGVTVPDRLTPEYCADHATHSYWIPVRVDPEDPSTFPRLRYYSSGVAQYDTDYAADPAPDAKGGWILYLIYER